MEFKLSQAKLQQLAQIEAEADCDIEAGFDFGQNLGVYLKQTLRHSDDQLMAVLQEQWGEVLSLEELQEMVQQFQIQLRDRVIAKLQDSRST